MNNAAQVLAKKYAVAYVNVYGNAITDEQYHYFQDLDNQLPALRAVLFFMNTATFPGDIKEKLHAKISELCHADNTLQALLNFLYADRRLVLLPRVIHYIIEEYRLRHNIMPCTVKHAHELTALQKKDFEDFFSSLVSQTVEFGYELDPSLIAGIRFQTDTVKWEYSIDKQLRMIKQACKQKGPDGN